MNHDSSSHGSHDRETFSGFLAAPTVDLEGNKGCAQVGLKTTGLDLFFDDGQNLHFDLEGRLVRVATPNVQWRRGLSHRTIELRKRTSEAGGGFARRRLSGDETDQLVDAANSRMVSVRDALRAGKARFDHEPANRVLVLDELTRVTEKAAGFSVVAAHEDLARFHKIYDDIPILPPDQYGALVLMGTQGCRYNQCTFCGFYRGTRYREKPPAEFRRHIEEVIQYHGGGLALRRGIFLGQANALMGDRAWREEILQLVNEHFELPDLDDCSFSPKWWQGSCHRFTGITSFLDAFTGVRITQAEFAALRQLNLRQVFIGMETGDSELLKWLQKPATPQQLLDTVQSAKSGGVRVGVIVLLGAGGEKFFYSHVEQTIQLIQAMQLSRGDFVYLSPLVPMPDTAYARRAEAEQIVPLCADRMHEQEQLIRMGLSAMKKTSGLYIAHYEVEHFVY